MRHNLHQPLNTGKHVLSLKGCISLIASRLNTVENGRYDAQVMVPVCRRLHEICRCFKSASWLLACMQSTASHNKQRQPSEDPSPLASPPGHAGSTKGKGSGSSVTVLDMIEAGLLQPGEQNTTVTYKGTTHTASLQRNGTIMFRGGSSQPQPAG